MLRALVVVVVGLTLGSGGASAAASQPRRVGPPNVVLVFADDLGYGELGCYGQRKIQTPHLDRLAAEGMRFTRFYSASTVCAPARCSIMTGRHTGHGLIRGNREVGGWGPEDPEGQWPLAAEERTVAEVLQDVGYATACIGKWGLGGPGSEGHPRNQGFDHFYGYLCQRVAHNLYPTHLWRNHDVDVLRNGYFPAHQRLEALPEGWTNADWDRFRGPDFAPAEMLQEAVEWIGDHADRPFFLYFPSILPHAALQAPEKLVDAYPREWDVQPYLGAQGYLPCERPRATYAAMISYLDTSVGRLRAAIEAAGVADNTVFIFTSDNGTTFNGGVDREFFDSLAGLRGFKTNLYEGGIREPLIVCWPGHIAAGTTADRVLALYDLMPTICALAGAEPPAGIDGRSFATMLVGGPPPERAGEPEGLVYIEYPEGSLQQCVVMGDWKAIRPRLRSGDLSIELYDLAADPGEARNIASQHPEVVARAAAIMAREHAPSPLFPIPAIDSPADPTPPGS